MPAPIRFDEVRAWLFGRALPLWAGAGLDRAHGGSVEALDLHGRDSAKLFKRTRVQARQVYAFTHAHLLGWDGLDAAEHCWRFLQANGRREDGAWIRLIGREGGAVDRAADAYDIGTVLFALAWRARAGDADAAGHARASLDALDHLLADDAGGWRAAEDDPSLLLNPHMHLLEAAVELADATAEDRFAELARGLVGLFRERLFEPRRGVVLERYGHGWAHPAAIGQIIWPGHLYEWTWLLHRAGAVLGLDLAAEARALHGFAEARGLDPQTRLVDDGLEGEGLQPRRTFRCWAQAEALKAQLALFEHQGVDTRPRVAEIVSQLLDRYLDIEPSGGWRDRLGPGFQMRAADIPASILYHLILAVAELLRLEPKLSAPAADR